MQHLYGLTRYYTARRVNFPAWTVCMGGEWMGIIFAEDRDLTKHMSPFNYLTSYQEFQYAS